MAKKSKKASNSVASITEDFTGNNDFPSTITEDYWVYATVKQKKKFPRKFKTHKIGKWLLFTDIKNIDTTWNKIKKATETGFLGIGAKTATAKSSPNAISENKKVICVYTYNWQDAADVHRVEKALRSK